MAEQFTTTMTTAAIRNEVLTGTQDGVNVTFTLVNQPAAGSLDIFFNGVKATPTTHYTVSGKTITFAAGYEPTANDVILADYFF